MKVDTLYSNSVINGKRCVRPCNIPSYCSIDASTHLTLTHQQTLLLSNRIVSTIYEVYLWSLESII